MASFCYTQQLRLMTDPTDADTIDWESATSDDIRALLIEDTGTYVEDRSDLFIDTGGANDIVDDEITTVTAYQRQDVIGRTITDDLATEFVIFDADDVTFPSLGNGTNLTVKACIIFANNASDLLSRPIVFVDFADRLTDGTDFTVIFDTNGIFRYNNS